MRSVFNRTAIRVETKQVRIGETERALATTNDIHVSLVYQWTGIEHDFGERLLDRLLIDAPNDSSGLSVEADSPDAGPIKQMGLPVKFSKTQGKIWGPSPGHGQHTDEVLGEVGFDVAEIAKLRDTGTVQ